jgi:hypothetical protein
MAAGVQGSGPAGRAEAGGEGGAVRGSGGWRYVAAFAAYQLLALAAWWHLLASGLSELPAGSADPGQEVWFLAWLPHALGAGTNPFLSHAIYAPDGVNLLSNTSFDLLGLLFAPVTVLAGPVAALDVASLMAPAVSALAAFALCRRYVRWWPAAFAGGLVYGFGPFLATDLRYAHLDLTWLALPPVVLLLLDELLARQRRRPLPTGALLGAVVVAQFFVSTEMLAITAITVAVTLVVVTLARPRSVGPRLRAAWSGLAAAVAVAGAALAYPVWMVVDGPRHVDGAVWRVVGQISASVSAAVAPHAELAGVAFVSGGNGSYLGIALLAVLAAGAVAYWRSAALRLALALVVACYLLSLGYELHVGRTSLHVPLPAAVLGHLPLVDSIVPERFAAMVDLFAGVALAIVLDHVRHGESPGWRRARTRPARRSWTARSVLGGLVAGVALLPLLFVPPWPYATTPVRPEPALLDRLPASTSPAGLPVVAVYPDSPQAGSAEMVWQASGGFEYRLAGGYAIVPGPGDRATESPRLDALWLVFAAASLHRLHLPLSPVARRGVRASLRTGHVHEVVVLAGAAGSGAARRALVSVLGPPTRQVGGAVQWAVRATR